MLPLQFILLLFVVSLPRELLQSAADSGSTSISLNWLPPSLAFVLLIVAQAASVAFVFFRTRRTIRLLHDPAGDAAAVTRKSDFLFTQSRLTATFITGAFLFISPLASSVIHRFDGMTVLQYFMLPEVIFMLPAIGAWLAIWTLAYFVEEALRQRSLPYHLAQAVPVHDMPSLGSFLLMQARHNFFPAFFLLFQGFATAAADLTRHGTHSDAQVTAAEVAASAVSFVVLLIFLPFLLTRFWSTTPLFDSLRSRLDGVAARYRLRFRGIRIWRTHYMIPNAAIVGWLPRARYFLITDALLESLSDRQLEAVFAHEVGHGIHRHLLWMMAAILSVVGLATGLTGLLIVALGLKGLTGDIVSLGLSSALLAALGFAAIGWISPRFEHQADWFACRHMALRLREESVSPAAPDASEPLPAALAAALTPAAAPAEQVTVDQYRAGAYPHGTAAPASVENPPPGVPPLVQPEVAGAEIFISSLDAILEATHRDRNRRGLFHPSPANRMSLLRRLALDPAAETAFNGTLRRVRWMIVVLAFLATAAFAAALLVEGSPQNPTDSHPATVAAPSAAP